MRLIDLTGKKFGLLTAIKYNYSEKKWLCECECGNNHLVPYNKLTTGHTVSCGKHPKYKDISGIKFGRLLAVKQIVKNKHGSYKWLCRCDCGNEIIVLGESLRIGNTKSCGCYKTDVSTKHGMWDSRLYHIWRGMKQRCRDRNAKDYPSYGGRGITVCDEWKNNFITFYEWAMSHGYADNLSIDRIDNNGNYCPENCRWADSKTQNRNTSQNVYCTIGSETLLLCEWAEMYGIPPFTIRSRIKNGWTAERAIKTPVNRKPDNGEQHYVRKRILRSGP
jgi:hypothetical protein